MKHLITESGHKLVDCPMCGKTVQERGLKGHVRFAHADTKEGAVLLARKSAKTIARNELDRVRADGGPSLASGSKPKLARLGRTKPIVYRVSMEDAADEDRDGGFPCPKCGVSLELPDIPDGKGEEFELSCPDCGAVIELVADEVEADEVEAEEEEAEKTDAEKKADRFLEITALMASLRGCREKRSLWDNLLNGGPPVCDLLAQELELVRDAAAPDEELFEKRRDEAVRAVELRGKVQELEASGAEAAGPLVKGLDADLSALLAEVMADVKKRKGTAKKPGFWDSL